MTEENNIIGSIETIFQSQLYIKKNIFVLLKATLVLILVIFIIGFIASWLEIPMRKDNVGEFNNNIFLDGSIKYPNERNIIFLNESVLDEQIANILKGQNSYGFNDVINHLADQFQSKLIVSPRSFVILNKPKTDAVLNLISERNQRLKDSLSYVVKRNMFLDLSGTSLLEEIKVSESNVTSLRNSLDSILINFVSDFIPLGQSLFTFQIGKVNSISKNNPQNLVIKCSDCAPIVTSSFLTKIGVPKASINESELQKQSELLKQELNNYEKENAAKIQLAKAQIRQQVSGERKDYRGNFYKRWYSTLILLVNSLLFIMLLLRYFIIVRQKKLPRKSTDIIYYATNRTSRLYRFIALIIIASAILSLVAGFFSNLFIGPKISYAFNYFPFKDSLTWALLVPPFTFLLTVLTTWFFILISEWIDFISNCYEVVFHKAHENKINQNDKLGL